MRYAILYQKSDHNGKSRTMSKPSGSNRECEQYDSRKLQWPQLGIHCLNISLQGIAGDFSASFWNFCCWAPKRQQGGKRFTIRVRLTACLVLDTVAGRSSAPLGSLFQWFTVVLLGSCISKSQTSPEGSLLRSCGSQGPTSNRRIKYPGDLCLACVFFHGSKLLNFHLWKTPQHRLRFLRNTAIPLARIKINWHRLQGSIKTQTRSTKGHQSPKHQFQSIWQFPKNLPVPEQLETPFINSLQKTTTRLTRMVWGMVYHFATFSEVLLSWFLLLQCGDFASGARTQPSIRHT